MKQAFLDIDTQIDFMYPAGALYVPGAERILPGVARLNRRAVEKGIPLVSTVCAHSEDDPEFREWPPHCVLGTVGQQKPSSLLVGQRVFEKQTTDLFQSPETASLVAEIGAEEFVIYGVATEICVQAAAWGLLDRGKRVAVVTDAVCHLNPSSASLFWKQLAGRGGRAVDSNAVLE